MTCLPLQDSVIYGPLYSRRLGKSLGVNILPLDAKVCSFNCAYCHFGATHMHTLHPEGVTYPPVNLVLRTLELALGTYTDIDVITFSGNGEPTLRPQFLEIVKAVCNLRDELSPNTKLALFSNASTLAREPVREALQYIDIPMLKLDAGDEATFQALNRPASGLTIHTIIQTLQDLPSAIIQSALVDGCVSNITGDGYAAWLDALQRILPVLVQIYSTDYPVPEAGLIRVPQYRLQKIARDMQCAGLSVRVYGL